MILNKNWTKFLDLKINGFTGRHGSEGGIGGEVGKGMGMDAGHDGHDGGGFRDLGDVHPDSGLGRGLREAGLMDHAGRTIGDVGFGSDGDVGQVDISKIAGVNDVSDLANVSPNSALGQALRAAGYTGVAKGTYADGITTKWSAPVKSFDISADTVAAAPTHDVLGGSAAIGGLAASGAATAASPTHSIGGRLAAVQARRISTQAAREDQLAKMSEEHSAAMMAADPSQHEAMQADFQTRVRALMTTGTVLDAASTPSAPAALGPTTSDVLGAPATTTEEATQAQEPIGGWINPDTAFQDLINPNNENLALAEAMATNPAQFGLTNAEIEAQVNETALAGIRNLTPAENAVLEHSYTRTMKAFNDPRRKTGDFTMAQLETMHNLNMLGYGPADMTTVDRVVDAQIDAFGKNWGPIRPDIDMGDKIRAAAQVANVGFSADIANAPSVKSALGTVASIGFGGLMGGISPVSALAHVTRHGAPRATQTALGVARAALDPSSLGQAAGALSAAGAALNSRTISGIGGLLGGLKGLESPSDIGKLKAASQISKSLKGIKAGGPMASQTGTVRPGQYGGLKVPSKEIAERTQSIRQIGPRDFGLFDRQGQLMGVTQPRGDE